MTQIVVFHKNFNKIINNFNKFTLKSNKFSIKSKYFKEQVQICREAGLVINTSLVIGYPQETSETLKETMTQLEKLKVYPSTGFLLALPETGMWKYAIENNYIENILNFLTQRGFLVHYLSPRTELEPSVVHLSTFSPTSILSENKVPTKIEPRGAWTTNNRCLAR